MRCPGAQLSRQGTLHETIRYANRDLHERRLTGRNSPGRSKETCATQKRPTYTPKETWKAGSRPHCHPRGLIPFAGSAWVCFLALLHPTHRIRVSMVRAKARVRQGREEGEGERRATVRGGRGREEHSIPVQYTLQTHKECIKQTSIHINAREEGEGERSTVCSCTVLFKHIRSARNKHQYTCTVSPCNVLIKRTHQVGGRECV